VRLLDLAYILGCTVVIVGCTVFTGLMIRSCASGAEDRKTKFMPDHEHATQNARNWAKTAGFSSRSVQCASFDSPQWSGYVPCTVSYKSNNGDIELLHVECASVKTWQGCKKPSCQCE